MSKLTIIKSEDNLKASETKVARVDNLYKDELLEVGLYRFKSGSGLSIEPTKSEMGIKTYTFLEGACRNLKTEDILTVGDIIVMKNDTENLDLRIVEDTKILVQAYQDAVFSDIDTNVKIQLEILEKIQNKDHYTDNHCLSVRQFSDLLAMRLGYKESRLHNFLRAARCHDIGKIYIRDAILLKPGPLNEEEFAEMKEHVVLGKELVKGRNSEEIFNILSQHHERIDGSGYPKGLIGEEISEEGRVLAIIDSYDAMTTDRVYKKAKSHEEAVEDLRSLAGIKYDSRLVELFIEVIESKPDSIKSNLK